MKVFDRLTLAQVRDTDLSDVRADIVSYGHYDRRDKVAAWRKKTGTKVVGYFNFLTSWPAAGDWSPLGYQRQLHDLATQEDAWLKDANGEYLYFPWISFGRMYDFRNEALSELCIELLDAQDFGDGLWVDLVFQKYETWMDYLGRECDISPMEWIGAVQRILSRVGFDRVMTNGAWAMDQWLTVMLENAHYRLPEAYPLWTEGNVLSIDSSPFAARPVILEAQKRDGIIECIDPASRDLAIEIRDAALGS